MTECFAPREAVRSGDGGVRPTLVLQTGADASVPIRETPPSHFCDNTSTMLVPLMAVTLFLSAFLLFWCQPMVAKMVLPFLGGSASVWTACVLFFQTMLLAGYVYAHVLNTRLRMAGQLILHATLMLAGFWFLPIHFAATAGRAASEQPVLWLLPHLLAAIGVPFLVVSTTAPLLQSWLAGTHMKHGKDPYFLYAASNAGSL